MLRRGSVPAPRSSRSGTILSSQDRSFGSFFNRFTPGSYEFDDERDEIWKPEQNEWILPRNLHCPLLPNRDNPVAGTGQSRIHRDRAGHRCGNRRVPGGQECRQASTSWRNWGEVGHGHGPGLPSCGIAPGFAPTSVRILGPLEERSGITGTGIALPAFHCEIQ
jgi:hypothetical protein